MFKTMICLLIWTTVLIGCEARNGKAQKTGELDKKMDSTSHATANPGLDSSLISLKSIHAMSIEELLSQSWEMQDADKAHWDLLFWDTVENKRKYPSLCLFRDYSFSENPRCGLRVGSWKLNKANRLLELKYLDGTHKNYQIARWSLSEIILQSALPGGSEVLKFSSLAVIHKQMQDDPFYPANNRWRLKPVAEETDDQLQKRIKACVHFYALFFQDNYRRHEGDISFIGLPSCFVWYNGGISLSPIIELDKKWINCFYSQDQALRGYEILSTLLNKHELKWPSHAASWVAEIQSVLDQMCRKL